MAKHKQETKQRKENKHTQGHTRRWGKQHSTMRKPRIPARISGLINEARAIWRWRKKQSQCVKQLGLLHHQLERRECQTADVAANHSVSVLLKLLHFWIGIVFFRTRCLSAGYGLDPRGLAGNRTTTGIAATQECRDTNSMRRTTAFESDLLTRLQYIQTCTGEDNLPKSKIYSFPIQKPASNKSNNLICRPDSATQDAVLKFLKFSVSVALTRR